MLRNSLSVDMKVYALQLKQKSILGNFRKATFEIFFFFEGGGWLLLKRKQGRRRTCSEPGGFRFHFYQDSYLVSHETYHLLSLQAFA